MDKQQQQGAEEEKKGFTLVSLGESFFFYDFLIRQVWIDEKRPIVRMTDSHKNSGIFGAVSIEGNQQYADSTMYSTEIPSSNS